MHQKVSVISVEGPPVPIPNTEVKLNCAENTWLATARKNRSMLTRSERTDRMGNSNEFPIFTLMIFLTSSVGRALTKIETKFRLFHNHGENKTEYQYRYSSLAQSVEHMTVNHGVVGSSPTGGAIYVVRKDYYAQKSLIFKDFSCF